MEQSSKIPLLITKNSFSIKLKGKTAEALLQQPRPILWCNDGLHTWVPLVSVINQASVIRDKQKHAEANDLAYSPEFVFEWYATVRGTAEFMAQAIELMSQEKK